MNKRRVINELKNQYPGKTIICIPEDNPSEILCEIDPSTEHSEYSIVVSVIDASYPHVHKAIKEEYEVTKGTLRLIKDGQEHVLHEADTITINPGEIHYAFGNETWIKATSHPGWMPEDHILVKERS